MTQGGQGVAREKSRIVQDSPLSTNVICLEREHTRNIGISSGNREEYSKVAGANVGGKAEQREAYQTQASIGNNKGTSQVVLIP